MSPAKPKVKPRKAFAQRLAAVEGTGAAAPRHARGRLRAHGDQPALQPGDARFHPLSGGPRGGQARGLAAEPDDRRRVCRHADSGHHLVLAHPTAFEGRAAADRGTAAQSAGTRGPAVGGLLRRQQIRRAGLAHHERRGGRSQPDRHGSGGFRRRPVDRRALAGHPAQHQRAADRDRTVLHPCLRAGTEQGLRQHPPHFPGARQDHGGSHRPPHRIAGRCARHQGLPRRGRGGARLRRRRGAPAR